MLLPSFSEPCACISEFRPHSTIFRIGTLLNGKIRAVYYGIMQVDCGIVAERSVFGISQRKCLYLNFQRDENKYDDEAGLLAYQFSKRMKLIAE